MEAIAPQLHAFYNSPLSESERHVIHANILNYMASDDCVKAAGAHVASCVSSMFAPDGAAVLTPPDPLVLNFALHAIEARTRAAFGSYSREDRSALLDGLVRLLVTGFMWIVKTSAATSRAAPPGSGMIVSNPARTQLVQNLSKASRAAVELGKREWVVDTTSAFPEMVLGLIDQNGHSADSLPKIFSGMMLLTTLVDDALDSSRADVRAASRTVLLGRISSIADGAIVALEIGLRMSGPGLPVSVPAAACRTMGSLARVAPGVVQSAIDVLQRRSVSGACDEVSVEALGVLAELYGESRVPLRGPHTKTLQHVTDLLNGVAMRETVSGDSEVVELYRRRLNGYADAVLCRCVVSMLDSPEFEACLNGLMGTTMRWASETPSAIPSVLDTWIYLLETLEDADRDPNPLMFTAYGALARLCSKICMFSTNGELLRSLDVDDLSDDEVESHSELQENPEVLADIARTPTSLASIVALKGRTAVDDGVAEAGLHGEVGPVSCDAYVSKCVECLSVISRFMPDTIALEGAQMVHRVLGSPGPVGNESLAEHLVDKATAAQLAQLISTLLPPTSQAAKAMLESVLKCMSLSPRLNKHQTSASVTGWRIALDVSLLRTSALLCAAQDPSNFEEVRHVLVPLINVSREVLREPKTPPTVLAASALLLLAVGDGYRSSMFSNEPPIPPALINSNGQLIASLGVAGVVRWALELGSESNNPPKGGTKNTDGMWPRRMATLQQCCGTIFGDYMTACSRKLTGADPHHLGVMSRGAALSHSTIWALYDEKANCKDAVWGAVGRELSRTTSTGLRNACELVSEFSGGTNFNESARAAWLSCISTMVNCLGCMLRVFRRQISAEAPTLAQEVVSVAIYPATQVRSALLARSVLILLRDQLGDGYSADKEHLVSPAVDLAVRSLNAENTDVSVAAVGVITEALSRHWALFWPADVSAYLFPGIPRTPTRSAPSQVRQAYMAGFTGLVTAVRSNDAALSREGMAALERLNVYRKLFCREGGFTSIGGGTAVTSACLNAVWAFPPVQDEASSLVWGVANADPSSFFGDRGTLAASVVSMSVCSDADALLLVRAFGTPTDRPSFVKALTSMVNDMRFTSVMRKGPSL